VKKDELRSDLLQYALDNNLAGLMTQLVTAIGVVLILHAADDTRDWLWVWLAIAVFTVGVRLALHRYMCRTIHTVKGRSPEWIDWAWRLQKGGLLMAGLLWAALISIGFHTYPPAQQYLIMMVLAAMAGGASSVLAPMRVMGPLYMLLLMGPVCFQLARQGSNQWIIAVIGAAFFLTMLMGHRNNHAKLRKAINLQNENWHLVEQLTLRTAEVMTSNAELEARVDERTRSLHSLAHHDPLTTLLNRRGLMHQLSPLPYTAPHSHAVLFVDLDHFKQLNDGLGHVSGDAILQEVARRLTVLLPTTATVARWGGDEFIVVSPALLEPRHQAMQLAQRLHDGLSKTYNIESASVQMGVSIGIAVQGDDGDTIDTLLQAADLASAEAKRLGRGRIVFYDGTLARIQRRKHDINAALRNAVHDGSLSLHFQPLVSAATGAVVSVEALLRWNPPHLGAVGPQEFIPLAEESDRIVALGAWVLQQACRTAAGWAAAPGGDGQPPTVAVNVSMRQLATQRFGSFVAETLAATHLPAARLVVEVTESVFDEHNQERIQQSLQGLRALGVQIHIDDFGTGYSSLSRLREFPIDGIKIDRSFVAKLDDRALAVVESAVLIAKRFSLKIIAEGIETPAQAHCLQALGVDEFQGYLFGKPQPIAQLRGVAPDWRLEPAEA